MAARATRRRADGWLRCPTCRDFRPAAEFRYGDTPRPAAYCREHERAYQRRAWARRAERDPEGFERAVQRSKPHRDAHNAARKRERARINGELLEVAQIAVRYLRSRGLFKGDIARLARVHPETVIRWERGGMLYPRRAPIERVSLLMRLAGDLPPWQRVANTRGHRTHPYYALLEQRFGAALAAP